jgi:hypothetical protein
MTNLIYFIAWNPYAFLYIYVLFKYCISKIATKHTILHIIAIALLILFRAMWWYHESYKWSEYVIFLHMLACFQFPMFLEQSQLRSLTHYHLLTWTTMHSLYGVLPYRRRMLYHPLLSKNWIIVRIWLDISLHDNKKKYKEWKILIHYIGRTRVKIFTFLWL